MIRNKEEAVTFAVEGDDHLYVRIPKSIAEKSNIAQGFSVTYVASLDSIRDFIENGSPKATYDGGVNGAILLLF